MNFKIKENKGITLIALIITIIVLLILAGISILSLTENGLLSEAQQSKKKTEIEEYIEKMNLAKDEVAINNLGEVTVDSWIEQIYENGIVSRGSIDKSSDEEVAIIYTEEGYVFKITLNSVTYCGTVDEMSDIELLKANIKFSYSPSDWTNGNVVATITSSITATGYILQTSIDGTTWEETTTRTFTTNGKMYARLFNGTDYGEVSTGNITNIDTTVPTIGSVSGSTEIGDTGTITVSNIVDTGGSGLKGIYISTSSTTPTQTSVTWISNISSSYTKTVNSNGTYYVWVLDNAGNVSSVKNCTISGIVTLTDSLSIEKGDTETITLTYSGTAKTVTYSSTDESIATVSGSDDTVTVTGVSGGITTIIVTITKDDGTTVSETYLVEVIDPTEIISTESVELIKIENEEQVIGENGNIQDSIEEYQLEVSENVIKEGGVIKWSSLDNSIVTINQNGKISFVGIGETTVACEYITNSGKIYTDYCSVKATERLYLYYYGNQFETVTGGFVASGRTGRTFSYTFNEDNVYINCNASYGGGGIRTSNLIELSKYQNLKAYGNLVSCKTSDSSGRQLQTSLSDSWGSNYYVSGCTSYASTMRATGAYTLTDDISAITDEEYVWNGFNQSYGYIYEVWLET